MSLEADLCAAAARNNADWCDAMARAHGGPGQLVPGAWLNRQPAPRFYPNLVTLEGAHQYAAHLATTEQLLAAPPQPGWAVKDSFAALDLAPLGFELLFEASWIHRPAHGFGAINSKYRAHRVSEEAALAAWEHAWRGAQQTAPARLFPATLLNESDHMIIAVVHGDPIVAGCIASRSAGVLGISNLFAEDDGARRACLDAATRAAPGLPLVGYERADNLARMMALGFAVIGPLRVWQAAR
jgi:hypothetical protein